jgi:hypothetical protein
MEIMSRESDVNDVQAAAFDAVMLQANEPAMSLCCPSISTGQDFDQLHGI